MHVPHGREGVVAHERAPVGHVVLQDAALLAVAGIAEQLRAQGASHAREEVRPVGDEDGFTLAVFDGGRRVLDVVLEDGATRVGSIDVAVVDPENLRHRRRVVETVRADAHERVDVLLADTGVVQGPADRQAVMPDGVEMGCLRIVAQADAGDDRRSRAQWFTSFRERRVGEEHVDACEEDRNGSASRSGLL